MEKQQKRTLSNDVGIRMLLADHAGVTLLRHCSFHKGVALREAHMAS